MIYRVAVITSPNMNFLRSLAQQLHVEVTLANTRLRIGRMEFFEVWPTHDPARFLGLDIHDVINPLDLTIPVKLADILLRRMDITRARTIPS